MFQLTRFFSITSLLAIIVVVIGLSSFLRSLSLDNLMAQQTRANVDLTRIFSNSILEHFTTLVVQSYELSPQQLKQHPEVDHLYQLTKLQMTGMNIVKVKLYNLSGMTIFSTDLSQVGRDKSKNSGFLRARNGEVVSEITFRNELYALEGIVVDRNLIASYVPVYSEGEISAVFEVYSDVTPLVENINAMQYKIVSVVLVALAVLYIFLFAMIRHAEGILRRHENERQENEKRITYQAYHDSLTGLANRDSFNTQMVEALQRVKRHDKYGALMFIDLDRFKVINDSLGHDAGDHILMVTAKRLEKVVRDTDLAFRMGGDEFVVILDDLERPEDASRVAMRILDEMRDPVKLHGHEIKINMSIGISTYSGHGDDVEKLIREADSAMYSAKESGHNHFEFYTEAMSTAAYERFTMETELQQAIDNNEFVIHYQPKISATDKRISSVEALLRWQHPKRGLLLPKLFLQLLEETGLIAEVGEWVLMESCRQLKTWRDEGLAPLRVAVNISSKQFRSHTLCDTVKECLKANGLDPAYLELEITESMIVGDMEHAIATMESLKNIGVSLSIDDFGTGYSSLNYLKQFPVDYLKIDRSFIKDLMFNEKDAAITSAIAALAQRLNLGLVAEGVEDESQLAFLKQQGCQEFQGFFFSEALPENELKERFLCQNDSPKMGLVNE